MVLISFGGNDAHMVADSDRAFVETTLSSYRAFIYKFKIGLLAIAFWEKIIIPSKELSEDELVHRVGVQDYKNNLIKIIEISKANNIECILLTRPFIGKSPNKLWWKNFAPSYIEATIEVGKIYNIQVVDIYSYFKEEKKYFVDESHFSEEGHRLAAKIISNHLGHLFKKAEDTLFDFGTLDARSYMREGWSFDEKSSDGTTFVWSEGKKSVLEFFLSDPREIQMSFRCYPLALPGSPSQTIAVVLNGKEIDHVVLHEPGFAEYRIVLPNEAVMPGENRLEFRYTYARAPKDIIPGAADVRQLAVSWDYIRLVHHRENTVPL